MNSISVMMKKVLTYHAWVWNGVNRAKEPGINSFAIHCVCSFWKKYLVTLLTFTLNVSILLNESKSYRWKANITMTAGPSGRLFHVTIWIVSNTFFEGLQLLMLKKVYKGWEWIYVFVIDSWNMKFKWFFSIQCCRKTFNPPKI